jgi:Icc-related predicted phosphoesterase
MTVDGSHGDGRLRIAAAGDLHCREDRREEVARSMETIAQCADIVLLCGDLTTHGEPEQGAVLSDACAALDLPILAVLGNHDWHANRRDELVAVLEAGGIQVLDGEAVVRELSGVEVGVVGVKGFVGGFSGSHLPDFGEPLLRQVYRETSREVDALDRGLREIALCPVRIVMLHYSPVEATLAGESPGIWTFLGTDRLAAPIAEHEPDLVVHGHAHCGTLEGAIGAVPVYNVATPVIARDFWILELDVSAPAHTPIH